MQSLINEVKKYIGLKKEYVKPEAEYISLEAENIIANDEEEGVLGEQSAVERPL